MSRTKYVTHLERQIDASKKAIEDLIRENFELKNLLREATKPQAKPAETSRTC